MGDVNDNLSSIPGNEESIPALLEIAKRKDLVPFLGAGFSAPALPQWGKFLDDFYRDIKGEFLLPGDEQKYLQLIKDLETNGYEAMADLLVESAKRRKFEEEMQKHFDKPLLPGMKRKFNLLHRAFPGLKITTNFDCFIENNGTRSNVNICYGNEREKLKKLFIKAKQNSLLKIHGGLLDIHSVVLDTRQYTDIYGHPSTFDPNAALPAFLERVFTNRSVLFIGCSMVKDRVIKIMESLENMHRHFAIMRRPKKQDEVVAINRRLSKAGIKPVWITDFKQIEDILEMIAPTVEIEPLPLDHGVPFVGRQSQLESIRENLEKDSADCTGSVQMITGRLFNIEGAGGVGKTTLAIEAAKQFSPSFEDGVFPPIRVDEHTPMSFALYLAGLFGLKVDEPRDKETSQALVTQILRDRRALLILDNAVDWEPLKYMLPVQTCSAILITTRNREMYNHLRLQFRDLQVHEIPLEKFTKEEALALFRKMLGDGFSETEERIYLKIAGNLGFLPIALRQAISLMLFGLKYSASRLLEKLEKEDRLDLLRKGRAVEKSNERAIESVFDLSTPLLTPEFLEALQYLAICAPGPVPLDFLQRLTGSDVIEERLEQLHTFSWCERRERDGERSYELHQLVRELIQARYGRPFKEEYINVVHTLYMDEDVHFTIKDRYMPQLEEAFILMKTDRDKRLTMWLYDLYYFCVNRGYMHFYLSLTESLEELFPDAKWTLKDVYGNRALIKKSWGKLEDAMTLHKKEEKIEEELGGRAGLAASYGNQALILKAWGKLDDAMTLHKKEEKICDQLGDRAGLARSYGNQALILKEWGKLDYAMTLHKKQEKICEELCDRKGLALSYCGQALILIAWGKLDDAMTLHKKEEKICEELGDRAGLARSWWNQGIVHEKREEYDTQVELWRKSIEMRKSMGIPTDYDEKELAELLEKIKGE